MHNMDWDDLRVFLAAARAGALLPAARRLGVDHSTVARRISALEAEIGAPLLDRSPRGVTLTAVVASPWLFGSADPWASLTISLLVLIELYAQQGRADRVHDLDAQILACQTRLSPEDHVRLGAVRNQFR